MMSFSSIPAVSLTYAEGAFFDLWMIPHILSGAVLGLLLALFFKRSKWMTYVIATAILVLWELIEIFFSIKEAVSNRIIDVVVGVIGIVVALHIISQKRKDVQYVLFGILTLALVILTLLGWLAYEARVG